MLWLLHLAAMIFYLPALFVTIPLHIIVAVLEQRKDPAQPTPDTHVRCPDCREVVRKDARICKHCRTQLTPQA
jgi:hypothetical protein